MSGFDAPREAWTRLALESRNVFLTWEFAHAWWRHFGDGARLRLHVDERFLLPLVVRNRGPLRVLRFVGHGPADELGPVCAQQDRPEAVRALRAELARGGWDVFAAEQLAGDVDWSALPVRRVSGDASPVLRFETRDWDAYLATRSSNFRQLVRKTLRKVDERGGEFRLADPSTLDRDLDTLLALHRERWHGAATGFDRYEAFHRDFAGAACEQGWLRLWLLEVGGAAAAAWYGFRYAGAESYYQAGRATEFDDLRPGLALLAHTVRTAQADGLDEYRFLRGNEPFKFRFTDDDPGVVTLAGANGVAGRSALTGLLAARALARRLRRSPRTAPPAA